jgi:hypothetical protein
VEWCFWTPSRGSGDSGSWWPARQGGQVRTGPWFSTITLRTLSIRGSRIRRSCLLCRTSCFLDVGVFDHANFFARHHQHTAASPDMAARKSAAVTTAWTSNSVLLDVSLTTVRCVPNQLTMYSAGAHRGADDTSSRPPQIVAHQWRTETSRPRVSHPGACFIPSRQRL